MVSVSASTTSHEGEHPMPTNLITNLSTGRSYALIPDGQTTAVNAYLADVDGRPVSFCGQFDSMAQAQRSIIA
jgi:hypothetical protein